MNLFNWKKNVHTETQWIKFKTNDLYVFLFIRKLRKKLYEEKENLSYLLFSIVFFFTIDSKPFEII